LSGAETAAPVRALFLFSCFAGKNQKDQLASSDQRKGLIYFVDEQKLTGNWLLQAKSRSASRPCNSQAEEFAIVYEGKG
jgi:hypothetical protein